MSSEKQPGGLLVITELFLPTKGGTAVWFDEVYRRIGGKEIHIVTADVPGVGQIDATHPNSIYRVSLQRHRWLRPESLVMYLKLIARSLQIMWSNKVTAVHAGRVLPEGLVGLIVARMCGKPLIIYAHGEEITSWKNPKKIRMVDFTYRHADLIIANSDFTEGALLDRGVDRKKIRIISPGVNVQRFKPGLECHDLRTSLGMQEQQKLLLSVGRLSRRKGFDQIIKSIPELLQKGIDVHYALVGIGEDREYLATLAKEMQVETRIHFLGHIDEADLPRWYNACDLFVMANREINGDTEGFGMVFLEAAACSKPVLAGTAGGTGSAVIQGETGIRVDGASLSEIKEAMMKLLTDSEFASQCSENAYERVSQQFSWESVAKKTLELATH